MVGVGTNPRYPATLARIILLRLQSGEGGTGARDSRDSALVETMKGLLAGG
jgi:hypothetical protein